MGIVYHPTDRALLFLSTSARARMLLARVGTLLPWMVRKGIPSTTFRPLYVPGLFGNAVVFVLQACRIGCASVASVTGASEMAVCALLTPPAG